MYKKIVIRSTRENYNASDMYSEINKTIPFVIQRPHTHTHLGISLSKKDERFVLYNYALCMI